MGGDLPRWRRMQRRGWGADRIMEWAGPQALPVDISLLASRLQVFVWPACDIKTTAASRWSEARGDIWFDARLDRTQQRLALAHGLGHLLLGKGVATETTFRGRDEAAPNKFAAGLLVPMRMLHPHVLPLWGDPKRLAGLFDVPVWVMENRLGEWAGMEVAYD